MSGWKKTARNIALGVAGAGTAFWIVDRLYTNYYKDDESADEIHYTTTEDGIDIGIWRHLPSADGPGEPVLIVHGLGVNHRHMDLNETFSIPEYLSARGYDCWTIELRGRGISEMPDHPWTFDDYAQKDIPAAIEYILEKTEFDRIHWVGHSMGAMLYYAVAGAVGYDDRIQSAVAAGGPFHGRSQQSSHDQSTTSITSGSLTGVDMVFIPLLELLRRLRIPWTGVARWSALSLRVLEKLIPRQFAEIMVNPDNIRARTARVAGVRAVESVSTSVLAQFLDWGLNRHWMDEEGQLDYRDSVSSINTPTLLIAGKSDKMCPVHNKKSGFQELGSDRKELIVAGEDDGFKADYSHIDMIYGEHAREEIFPLISDWLNRNPME